MCRGGGGGAGARGTQGGGQPRLRERHVKFGQRIMTRILTILGVLQSRRRVFEAVLTGDAGATTEAEQVRLARQAGPSSPQNRALVFAARTLKATGEPQASLSLLYEHSRAVC